MIEVSAISDEKLLSYIMPSSEQNKNNARWVTPQGTDIEQLSVALPIGDHILISEAIKTYLLNEKGGLRFNSVDSLKHIDDTSFHMKAAMNEELVRLFSPESTHLPYDIAFTKPGAAKLKEHFNNMEVSSGKAQPAFANIISTGSVPPAQRGIQNSLDGKSP